MFKKSIQLFFIVLTLNSCVSKKLYEELEEKYNKLHNSNSELIQDKDDLLAAKKQIETELEELTQKHQELETQKTILDNNFASLQNKYSNLDESYKLLSTQSSQKLRAQSEKNQELLAKLDEKEKRLELESSRLEKLQKELDARSQQITELENLIAAKEAQMQELKNVIAKALHKFEGLGLTVEQRNGKIYVSIDNKLLFNSGSWAVGLEGKNAIEKLAKVLAKNTDINVLIEGHTDNVPYKGTTLLDNWDLSVKRATAIVRILQNKGVNPTQITAAGRSEYVPIETNKTAKGRAKNRRIEIILTPNLDEITNLLNN